MNNPDHTEISMTSKNAEIHHLGRDRFLQLVKDLGSRQRNQLRQTHEFLKDGATENAALATVFFLASTMALRLFPQPEPSIVFGITGLASASAGFYFYYIRCAAQDALSIIDRPLHQPNRYR